MKRQDLYQDGDRNLSEKWDKKLARKNIYLIIYGLSIEMTEQKTTKIVQLSRKMVLETILY